MKKMKYTLTAAVVALAACGTIVLSGCQNYYMIKRVSTAFTEQVSGAVQMNAKIDMSMTEGASKQRVALELDGIENVKAQTADLAIKATVKADNKSETVYQDVYVRGEEIYRTDEYAKEDEMLGIVPVENVEDLLDEYFSDLNIDFELETEESSDSASELYSMLTFAQEYRAIQTGQNKLTFDINELIYNIVGSLKPAYDKINEETTVKEHFKERSVKRLINALAGDDTALDVYNDLLEEQDSLDIFSEYIDWIEEYKPEKGQNLYDYVLELIDSEDFAKETAYTSLVEEGESIGELTVYEILGKSGDAEEEIQEIRDELNGIKKEEIKIDVTESSSEGYVSLKNLKIVFELDGDAAKSFTLTGALEAVNEESYSAKQSVDMTLDLEMEYLSEEQQLLDLTTMSYAQEAFFVTGDPYGRIEYLAPDTRANIRSVMKDKKIEGIVIAYEEQETEAVYDVELGAYAYTLNGHDMLVWAENVPSVENHGEWQIRYVICFADEGKTPFNVFVNDFNSARSGYYYLSRDVYGKTDEELTTAVDGVNYKLNYDGKSYIVTGLADQTKKDIEIRSEVNGLPVKFIASRAFSNSAIESVKIPSSIINMSEAFSGCKSLRKVEARCVAIDSYTFNYCSNLETLDLIGVSRINESAFSGLKGLKNVSFGDKLFLVEDSAFYGCSNAQITIPQSLRSIGANAFNGCAAITEADLINVEKLGEYAFNNCSGIKKATLSRYVNDAEDVFMDCTSLEKVIIPDEITTIGDNCFKGCTSLKEITWSNNLQMIGSYAFFGCSSLKEVDLPESLERISHSAFSECVSLQNITVPRNVQTIEYGAFSKSGLQSAVILSENLRSIYPYTFSGCSYLQEVTLPDSLRVIEYEAFLDCVSLQNIVIPKNVYEIGRSAFQNTALQSISIPSGVRTIEDYAFSKTALKSIVIPENVTEIGFGIVSGCANITKITLPNNLKELPEGMYRDCPLITEFTLPKGMTSISAYAFAGCVGLTSITIPETVTTIGWYAFEGCTGLQSIIIPKGVTYIGDSAFLNCTSLSDVTLPEGLVELSGDLFLGCKSLKSIKLPSTIVRVGYTVFAETGLTEITIPFSLQYSYLSVFENCKDLTKVVFAEGVTQITDSLFVGCTSLKTVTIPKSVTKINRAAFKNATVEEIIYQGTVAEWKNLVWDTGWDAGIVSKTDEKAVVKIVCTDGTIQHTVTGNQ